MRNRGGREARRVQKLPINSYLVRIAYVGGESIGANSPGVPYFSVPVIPVR